MENTDQNNPNTDTSHTVKSTSLGPFYAHFRWEFLLTLCPLPPFSHFLSSFFTCCSSSVFPFIISLLPYSFHSHLQHNSLGFALLRWLHPASIYFYKVKVGNKDTRTTTLTLFRCLTLLILTNVTYCSGVCIIFYEQVVSAGQNAFSNRISKDF